MQFYYWCELKIMNVSWSSSLWFVPRAVESLSVLCLVLSRLLEIYMQLSGSCVNKNRGGRSGAQTGGGEALLQS